MLLRFKESFAICDVQVLSLVQSGGNNQDGPSASPFNFHRFVDTFCVFFHIRKRAKKSEFLIWFGKMMEELTSY